MKYNVKSRMLEFSSDEEVSRFHDQLTSALRRLMLSVGENGLTSHEEDVRLTNEFFEQYSELAETLRRLRSHMVREMEV
jgi:aspartate/tyrosine/aromatic aminotransferase